MSITNEIQGQIDYLRSEWAELSTWRHGCVCGAGDGGEPIDGLDTCCQAHDGGYVAVGHSAETMWTIDALIQRQRPIVPARCAPPAPTRGSTRATRGATLIRKASASG